MVDRLMFSQCDEGIMCSFAARHLICTTDVTVDVSFAVHSAK